MKSLTKLLTVVLLLVLTRFASAEVAYLNPSAETGISQCAVVKNCVLAHTSQILPVNFKGGKVVPGNAGDQTGLVLENLDYLLGKVDATLYKIVKLNVYVAREELVPEVKQRLIKELKFKVQPACTFVVSQLPDPQALVAMDVVAAFDSDKKISQTEIYNDGVSGFRVALLPAGRTAYISGQAVKADTLEEATKKTMEELHQTLKYLGGSPENIVHLKAFLTPMKQGKSAAEVIDGFFPDKRRPPVTLVEWFSTLPIEIEMIVALPEPAADSRPAETVVYKTPTGMKASPVFSRVAIAEVSDRIYVSGITSKEPGNYSTRIHSAFDQLKAIVTEAGSDMQHLAKATYYVSENEISGDFGKIRQEYYNPQRPPAASKATVKSVGIPNRILLMDMIAVPVK